MVSTWVTCTEDVTMLITKTKLVKSAIVNGVITLPMKSDALAFGKLKDLASTMTRVWDS